MMQRHILHLPGHAYRRAQVLMYCTLPQYRIVYCTSRSGLKCQQCQPAALCRACEDISQGVPLALLMPSQCISCHVMPCHESEHASICAWDGAGP